MPKEMLAQRFYSAAAAENDPLRLEQVPVPEPGPGQALIKVTACGVCHTDLHLVEGDIHPPQTPVTPGHQAVGVVQALGPRREPGDRLPLPPGRDGDTPLRAVQARAQPVQVGDRVGQTWLYAADGTCEFCQAGLENLCPNARFSGFHADGGFAEYLLVEADYALPLPDAIDDLHAAPLLCAGVVGYRTLRQAGLKPGERLGLVGFGASAHLAIQVARHWGCEVYVFTRSEAHRDHARQLGAAWAGGIEDDAPAQLDRAALFAPVGHLVPPTLAKLRPGGALAINAISLTPIPQFDYDLIYGERVLRSVANLTYQDGVEFLALAAEIPIQATVNAYPLEAANQALQDVKHSRLNGEAVLRMGKLEMRNEKLEISASS